MAPFSLAICGLGPTVKLRDGRGVRIPGFSASLLMQIVSDPFMSDVVLDYEDDKETHYRKGEIKVADIQEVEG